MKWQFSVPVAICGVMLVCAISFGQTRNAAPTTHADRIVVEKSKRVMKLMHGSEVLKAYRVALGG